ncbi:MAG TPA: DUF2612 domain-containing protein, partial [Candidatus Megamonas gallistercoris]|nr:DUF2612 domain-containing protein [Candidatus Megamonas gallistercoris]
MALLDSYLNLITSQHKIRNKYMATVKALLSHSDDIFNCAVYFDDEFDLDLSTGNQENILGSIAGVDRTLDFQPDKGLSPVL